MSNTTLRYWTFLWHHANQTDKREVTTLLEDLVKDVNFRVKDKKKSMNIQEITVEVNYLGIQWAMSEHHLQSEGHYCISQWLPWRRKHNACLISFQCSLLGITEQTHELSHINSIRKGFCKSSWALMQITLWIRNNIVGKNTWGISSNSKEQNHLIHSNITNFKKQP